MKQLSIIALLFLLLSGCSQTLGERTAGMLQQRKMMEDSLGYYQDKAMVFRDSSKLLIADSVEFAKYLPLADSEFKYWNLTTLVQYRLDDIDLVLDSLSR